MTFKAVSSVTARLKCAVCSTEQSGVFESYITVIVLVEYYLFQHYYCYTQLKIQLSAAWLPRDLESPTCGKDINLATSTFNNDPLYHVI
jgi:hypothetical protein